MKTSRGSESPILGLKTCPQVLRVLDQGLMNDRTRRLVGIVRGI